MKKLALCVGLTVVALSATAEARSSRLGPAAYQGVEAYACTNYRDGMVTVRAGAGTNYKTIDLIDNGTDVSILAEKVGRDGFVWYKISYGCIQGWSRSDYICQ